jgi:putative phosphoesterase
MLVGVVADSHVGERMARLPDGTLEALEGVDLILHAGDITEIPVLERLERVAPVAAVQGDHDREAGIVLPRLRVVRAAGWRIGLVHGDRRRSLELVAGALSLALGRPCLLGFHRAMLRRFGSIDCLVHGHLHLPICRRVDGVLCFSPGAIDLPERRPGLEAGGPAARAYLGFRRRLGETSPSVGLMEIDRAGIRPRIVPVGAPPGGSAPMGPPA